MGGGCLVRFDIGIKKIGLSVCSKPNIRQADGGACVSIGCTSDQQFSARVIWAIGPERECIDCRIRPVSGRGVSIHGTTVMDFLVEHEVRFPFLGIQLRPIASTLPKGEHPKAGVVVIVCFCVRCIITQQGRPGLKADFSAAGPVQPGKAPCQKQGARRGRRDAYDAVFMQGYLMR